MPHNTFEFFKDFLRVSREEMTLLGVSDSTRPSIRQSAPEQGRRSHESNLPPQVAPRPRRFGSVEKQY